VLLVSRELNEEFTPAIIECLRVTSVAVVNNLWDSTDSADGEPSALSQVGPVAWEGSEGEERYPNNLSQMRCRLGTV